jgi:hypothetical protein
MVLQDISAADSRSWVREKGNRLHVSTPEFMVEHSPPYLQQLLCLSPTPLYVHRSPSYRWSQSVISPALLLYYLYGDFGR